jgi:hypothetical protein
MQAQPGCVYCSSTALQYTGMQSPDACGRCRYHQKENLMSFFGRQITCEDGVGTPEILRGCSCVQFLWKWVNGIQHRRVGPRTVDL